MTDRDIQTKKEVGGERQEGNSGVGGVNRPATRHSRVVTEGRKRNRDVSSVPLPMFKAGH